MQINKNNPAVVNSLINPKKITIAKLKAAEPKKKNFVVIIRGVNSKKRVQKRGW